MRRACVCVSQGVLGRVVPAREWVGRGRGSRHGFVSGSGAWSRCGLSVGADTSRAGEQFRQQRVEVLTVARGEGLEFGYRLLADEARVVGFPLVDRTVWRLCSEAGILSAILRSRKKKHRKPGLPVWDDVVSRTSPPRRRIWCG